MNRDCADILDRASIARLKAENIGNDENHREDSVFTDEVNKYAMENPNYPILMFFDLLYKINKLIWKLEFDLRQGKLDGALAEVGRRAIEIREHNNLRVQTKNIVNTLMKEGFIDIKRGHVSE
jgi:hypothetical protein